MCVNLVSLADGSIEGVDPHATLIITVCLQDVGSDEVVLEHEIIILEH